MAGQGANLGFGDVATLTDVIVEATANGADIGSAVYLEEYQSRRLQHNIPVMASIHGLHFLYNTTWTPFVMLRSVGFNLIDALHNKMDLEYFPAICALYFWINSMNCSCLRVFKV